MATSSVVAGPRQLYAMDLPFCAVASGILSPIQLHALSPSRHLELQLHGDLQRLTAAASQLAKSKAGL